MGGSAAHLARRTLFEHTANSVTSDPTKETDDVSGAARAAGALEEGGGADGRGAGGGPGDGATAEDADAGLEAEPAEIGPDPDAVAAAPPAVAELAAACVRFVSTRYKTPLDFTPETLSLLDQWIRDARTEVAAVPESAELVQSAAGAYLGEVIRRAFGARWFAEGDVSAWRLYLSRVYCAVNPVGLVREALILGPAEGWHAHFELDPGERDAIEARLASLPAADDEEFYAPTTRFDVLSIVFDALREGLRARGLGDVRFTPEDYG